MSKHPPISTVVFDLGNVLVRWDPYGPFVGRLSDQATRAFLTEFDFATFNHRQDAGRTWAEARLELERIAPEHVPAMDVYVEHMADSLLGPVPGTHALVQDLRDAGIRLLGLTNWSAETFHLAEPAAPAIGLLESVLVSGRERVAKPDPAIFALLTQRYRLDPAGTVFVDDAPANVAAGSAAGFDAIRFTAADDLRAELVDRGIEIPRHLTVDGETFAVRRHDDGERFDWLSGPNPGYGFSSARSDGAASDGPALEASIRRFLSLVDPVTGYIE
ncbi:MAG: HAD family phosphatase [Brevundimonas sp.]